MHIRPEEPADYPAVANVHIQAFGYHSDEALIVALLRQREAYDPELSLVAEIDGKIVGHAFFMPYMVQFAGTPIPSINLAPLSVLNAYQRQGVGSALMEEGHAVARSKGYEMAFLLGHSSYYPRFGYETHSFGHEVTPISKDHIQGMALPVQTRPPTPEDLPALRLLWLAEEEDVEFILEPEQNMNAWISPNPKYPATVYLQNGTIIGYTRGYPNKPLVFLAKHEPAAKDIAHYLLGRYDCLHLPLHPESRSVRAFANLPPIQPKPWTAAMVAQLRPEPLVTRYLQGVWEGTHAPGRPIWPPAFDLAHFAEDSSTPEQGTG